MYKRVIKRILDFIFALVAYPFMMIISVPVAIAIKLEDGGPIIFADKRVGKDFKEFRMYKFRSMRVNAPDIRNGDGSTYNAMDDPRMTRVGKLLRKTSIDELPQIHNVLLGQMSFVGPRPSPLGNRHTYPDNYLVKFSLRPGLTGYNQVMLRNHAKMTERMENDVYYVNHQSLALDAKIVILTVLSVFSKKNIYQKQQKAQMESEHIVG